MGISILLFSKLSYQHHIPISPEARIFRFHPLINEQKAPERPGFDSRIGKYSIQLFFALFLVVGGWVVELERVKGKVGQSRHQKVQVFFQNNNNISKVYPDQLLFAVTGGFVIG
jgi:hypothetical protein